MSRSRLLVVAAVIVVILLGGVAWSIGLFSSDPEAANVDDLAEAVAESGEGGTGEAITTLDGTWNVQQLEGVFVGYRIDEILSGIDFTAVGRTGDVTGTLTGAGSTVSAVSIEADLTTLESDNGARDGQLKTQALETNDFPTATFTSTAPIELGAIPGEGEEVTTEATGDLTIHGVTRSVSIPITASQQSGSILVAGQLDVLLTDHGIDTPSAPIVAGVSETAVMEFSLVFSQG
ncbi:MAG: YceI family protein [Acidimicrobiales bacterium]